MMYVSTDMLWFKSNFRAVSPAQCRASRAILRMTLTELASASGLALDRIIAFESDEGLETSAIARIKLSFEKLGIVFLDNGAGLNWQLDTDVVSKAK